MLDAKSVVNTANGYNVQVAESGYEQEIESFDLIPGGTGEFEFVIDGELVYSKKATGEFPDLKVLQQAVVEAIDTRTQAAS